MTDTRIPLVLKTLTGKTVTFEELQVEMSDTVETLVSKIAEKEHMPCTNQVLMYGGLPEKRLYDGMRDETKKDLVLQDLYSKYGEEGKHKAIHMVLRPRGL